jgi:hypothetical protein
VGITYWGIICAGAGGQAVAASGAAYVVGGQQTGAGGGHGAGRLKQLQGQHGHRSPGAQAAHPLNVAGIVATASKIIIFFMISLSPLKAVRDYCLGRVAWLSDSDA